MQIYSARVSVIVTTKDSSIIMLVAIDGMLTFAAPVFFFFSFYERMHVQSDTCIQTIEIYSARFDDESRLLTNRLQKPISSSTLIL